MTPDLFRATLAEEMEQGAGARSAKKAFKGGRFAEAIELFSDHVAQRDLQAFLTLPAYRLID